MELTSKQDSGPSDSKPASPPRSTSPTNRGSNSLPDSLKHPNLGLYLPIVPSGPLAGCLIEIIAMLSTFATTDASKEACRRSLEVIVDRINELSDSFKSHFRMHPYTSPEDGDQQADYYLRLFVGKQIQGIISTVMGDDNRRVPYTIVHLQHFVNYLSGLQLSDMEVGDVLAQDHFTQWQRLLKWWKRVNEGPSAADITYFYQRLRFLGLVHLPQLGHCTCTNQFTELYCDTVRLCLMLRYSNVGYSFAPTPQMTGLLNMETGQPSSRVLDCVVPPLKVRQRSGKWETVFPGCGVGPREGAESQKEVQGRAI